MKLDGPSTPLSSRPDGGGGGWRVNFCQNVFVAKWLQNWWTVIFGPSGRPGGGPTALFIPPLKEVMQFGQGGKLEVLQVRMCGFWHFASLDQIWCEFWSG